MPYIKHKMENLSSILDVVIQHAKENNIFHTLNCYTLTNTFSKVPMLIIKNKEQFIKELSSYIDVTCKFYNIEKTDDIIKQIIINLFEKANYEDFSNPIRFIKNQINYYLDNTFKNDNSNNKQQFDDITPYAYNEIEYGISNNICYIYKINSISQLAYFFNELYKKNITIIKIVSYLPLKNNDYSNVINNIEYTTNILNNIVISSYPFEEDEYINLKIEGLINNIDEDLLEKMKGR